MKKATGLALVAVAAMMLTQACAHHSMTFDPGEIDPDYYVKKVDQFIIIADGSMSMADRAHKQQKMGIELAFLDSLNQTIPEFDYAGGLRVFGKGACGEKGKTVLIREVEQFASDAYGGAIDNLECIGGLSPLGKAIDASGGDLGMGKPTAVVIVSDGLNMTGKAVKAAEGLKEALGEDLTIYAVQVGGDGSGEKLLEKVVAAGGDGYLKKAHELTDDDDMKQFVVDVFLWPDDDADGVPNHLDKCPDTPRGVEVDAVGCPLDSDGDGVPDYLDECPGTPKGVEVDAKGCPIDSDGDGVPDAADKCPNTPRGVKVDKVGCPLDSDGDGVPDYLDKCPGTPRGVPVDDNGCPPTGVVILGDEWAVQGQILFDLNKATLKPDAKTLLDRVVTFLKKNRQWHVEIQGHTDSTGPKAWNDTLSKMRAESVMNYLVANGVPESRLTAVGYGSSEPIADNGTKEGRQQNRRVDFRPHEK
jgi:OOP family OmpA-OmpF porin